MGRSRLTTKDEFNCLFDLLVFVGEEDVFFDPICRIRVRVQVQVKVKVWVRVGDLTLSVPGAVTGSVTSRGQK